MAHIKYYVHDNSMYLYPHYMEKKEVRKSLVDLGKEARSSMEQAKAKHAVYAVVKLDKTGEISQVDFYTPPVCLGDKDFYERTDAIMKSNPDSVIYATHAW